MGSYTTSWTTCGVVCRIRVCVKQVGTFTATMESVVVISGAISVTFDSIGHCLANFFLHVARESSVRLDGSVAEHTESGKLDERVSNVWRKNCERKVHGCKKFHTYTENMPFLVKMEPSSSG